ncbi:MAG: phosphohydrolase [Desulfobacteraceae bacterium]|nr:MAG: phosphohydrolase [Desulfobacteraceae bacterium]
MIYQYYRPGALLTELLLDHSRRVRDKALAVAARIVDAQPDLQFIAQAAMLHDIGICRTAAPSIHCYGRQAYVHHGMIGRGMVEAFGLNRHALVCERHVGTGITLADIRRRKLPLPLRDMTPQALEEVIICYADKFFSKTENGRELPVDRIIAGLSRYGKEKAQTFLSWHARFNP